MEYVSLRWLSTWYSLANLTELRKTKSRKRLFIAALFLSLWRRSAVDRGLSVKPGLGHLRHWQTMRTQIRTHKTRRLFRVCTVCLNYRKIRLNETVPRPCSGPFYHNQRQSTHQWCQCFKIDLGNLTVSVTIILYVLHPHPIPPPHTHSYTYSVFTQRPEPTAQLHWLEKSFTVNLQNCWILQNISTQRCDSGRAALMCGIIGICILQMLKDTFKFKQITFA